jgi:hypothetical protein
MKSNSFNPKNVLQLPNNVQSTRWFKTWLSGIVTFNWNAVKRDIFVPMLIVKLLVISIVRCLIIRYCIIEMDEFFQKPINHARIVGGRMMR